MADGRYKYIIKSRQKATQRSYSDWNDRIGSSIHQSHNLSSGMGNKARSQQAQEQSEGGVTMVTKHRDCLDEAN